jgi:hypothetical protein
MPEFDKIPSNIPSSAACTEPNINTLKNKLRNNPKLSFFIIFPPYKREGAWAALLTKRFRRLRPKKFRHKSLRIRLRHKNWRMRQFLWRKVLGEKKALYIQ